MHPKRIVLGTTLSILALTVLFTKAAVSQQTMKPPFVLRQASTPGVTEVGHLHISGTAIAGQFQGGGAGLTGLNATNITQGTLDDERLSLNIANRAEPNVFAVGPNSFYNGAGANGTLALYAETSSTAGQTITGKFVNKSVSGIGLQSIAAVKGVDAAVTSATGIGLHGYASNSSGTNVGVWGRSAGNTGRGVIGETDSSTGFTVAGYFSDGSLNGIGVYAEAAANSGATAGGSFRCSSPSGVGVLSNAAGTGGKFVSTGGTGIEAFGSTTTSSTGVFGQGTHFGVQGEVTSSNAAAVYGNSSGASDGYGVWGQSSSTTGRGVVGIGSGVNGAGGYFTATDASGTGVVGVNTGGGTAGFFSATTGLGLDVSTNTGNYAVRGQNNSPSWWAIYGHSTPTTGTGVGVLGQAESASGWGLYAIGRSGGTGTKLFRIDHPLDPENKYLNHYSSESPEPINFYSGTVTTDNKGEAWVQLPDYFSAVNKDFRYTLTVVDDTDSDSFVLVKVAKKIQGNRFKIRSSVGNTEVSWRVDARRNDLWVQRYGAPETTVKPENARGKYQHPELYGKPKQLAEWYVPSKVEPLHP